MSRPSLKPGLYAILDHAPMEKLLKTAKDLIEKNISAIQVRGKSLENSNRRKLVESLARFLRDNRDESQSLLIVNDDIALARELECGLHLGQEDTSAEEARKILGEKAIIGLSTHTMQQVQEANSLEIDYIGFGPVFPTASKENALSPRGIEGLQRAVTISEVPVVAIGGISWDHLETLRGVGTRHFAMLSALNQDKWIDKLPMGNSL